ncbi:type IV secretion system protein [Bartonella sp. CB74]|uniref:type IV secretion system protein n=1 Tax=Bartonella sp. CB74 TaxID=3113620 RepID=UPI002F9641C3
MTFQMFTQLFDTIDDITKTYITDFSSNTIATITPFVSIGLTISFIIYGWLIMCGAIDMPLAGFMNRCLRVSIITSIALTAGLYQSDIANILKELPDALSSTFTNNSKIETKALIDKVADKGLKFASDAFEEAAFLNADGLLYGIFGILILLATSFLVAISGAFLLLIKIALILLLGLGPFFILALLWQPTYRFFQQWAAQLLSYTILTILLTSILGLIMGIFANYMEDLKFDGEQNVSYALGGAITLSIIFIVLLIKLSSIASALAKGITFGHLWKPKQ